MSLDILPAAYWSEPLFAIITAIALEVLYAMSVSRTIQYLTPASSVTSVKVKENSSDVPILVPLISETT